MKITKAEISFTARNPIVVATHGASLDQSLGNFIRQGVAGKVTVNAPDTDSIYTWTKGFTFTGTFKAETGGDPKFPALYNESPDQYRFGIIQIILEKPVQTASYCDRSGFWWKQKHIPVFDSVPADKAPWYNANTYKKIQQGVEMSVELGDQPILSAYARHNSSNLRWVHKKMKFGVYLAISKDNDTYNPVACSHYILKSRIWETEAWIQYKWDGNDVYHDPVHTHISSCSAESAYNEQQSKQLLQNRAIFPLNKCSANDAVEQEEASVTWPNP
jgi:hypothetical protein